MYQHDALDGKLQYVQIALEKVKNIENLILDVQTNIFATFHRRLTCDTSDLRQGLENLHGFVKCLTVNSISLKIQFLRKAEYLFLRLTVDFFACCL